MMDLIIVGGGPAGLQLANWMAESGYQVLLLDDRSSIGERKVCTGILGAEAFRRFDLSRKPILRDIQDINFVSPSGNILEYSHPELLAHVLDRTGFDRVLAESASKTGGRLLTGTRVTGLQVHPDGVEVTAVRVSEPQRKAQFRSRLLAIATGVTARLNKLAGLGSPTRFLSAVQAHVPIRHEERTHCFAGRQVAPGAFGWMVPINGKARIGLMAEGRAKDHFDALLRRVAPFRTDSDAPVEPEYKPIAQSFEGRSYADRVIAVGEAAGQVKTTTGGGIYYGLLGAEFAHETLNQALERKLYDSDFLSRYEALWKGELSEELENGYFYRQVYGRLSDRKIETLFKLAKANGIIPLVKKKATFDWHADVLRSVAGYRLVRRVLGI